MLLNYETNGEDCVQERTGIVLNNCFQLFDIEHDNQWQVYPEFEYLEIAGNFDGDTFLCRGSYGVCDSVENLLEVYPELEMFDRKFIVNMCCINKDEEPESGGWRWCKWGEYIGKHIPMSDYLYDEPVIERVYCYHIYEKVA